MVANHLSSVQFIESSVVQSTWISTLLQKRREERLKHLCSLQRLEPPWRGRHLCPVQTLLLTMKDAALGASNTLHLLHWLFLSLEKPDTFTSKTASWSPFLVYCHENGISSSRGLLCLAAASCCGAVWRTPAP